MERGWSAAAAAAADLSQWQLCRDGFEGRISYPSMNISDFNLRGLFSYHVFDVLLLSKLCKFT